MVADNRMQSIKNICCVGGGVIGTGWAARFLLEGYNVTVIDANPDCQAHLADVIQAAKHSWQKMTLSPAPAEGQLQFTTDIAAVAQADFIQESLPEQIELKKSVYKIIETHAPSTMPIMSSTSGLLPSQLQADMQYPERFCVAHPFNPVYLLPLVEICGGQHTSTETITNAAALYQSTGMRPLILKKEIDGFIADRLMEALWREALWLVDDNVATASEIDEAIRLGCGLRWAFMGPFLTYRLGGGAGGMRHFMAQFAPTLALPWTKLMDVPDMDDALLDKIVAQSDEQAQGRNTLDLYTMRDNCLVSILQGLKGNNEGAGALLLEHEKHRYSKVHAKANITESDSNAPLRLHTTQVAAEWIDYNEHMTESRYLQVFGDATDAFLHCIGITMEYVKKTGSFYTVETHIRHLGQAYRNDSLSLTTQIINIDSKRVHLFHSMFNQDSLIATAEQMLLYVENDRACPYPISIRNAIESLWLSHQNLALPKGVGKTIGF